LAGSIDKVALMMEAVTPSETFVIFYETKRLFVIAAMKKLNFSKTCRDDQGGM
jgi:hypothetical protein